MSPIYSKEKKMLQKRDTSKEYAYSFARGYLVPLRNQIFLKKKKIKSVGTKKGYKQQQKGYKGYGVVSFGVKYKK